MKNIIYNILKILDKIYINPHLLIFGDYTGIASFCFHTVFENDKEKNNNHTLPNIGLTLDEYKYIFDFFKNNNYKFISTKDYKNLNYGDKCIHVTFDDGYFNTTKILPILKDYEIPIDFFIVGNNISNSNKFWWDIIYNKRISEGKSADIIDQEIMLLQRKTFEQIYSYIIENFGLNSYTTLSDLDRPMTENELRQFSQNKLVSIGNHTFDHAILNNLSKNEIYNQIKKTQDYLKSIIGYYPNSFAFPNSYYKSEQFEILKSLDIEYAFCGDFRHNKIPRDLRGEKKYRISRYGILSKREINWQLKMIRAGISPFIVAKEIKRLLF